QRCEVLIAHCLGENRVENRGFPGGIIEVLLVCASPAALVTIAHEVVLTDEFAIGAGLLAFSPKRHSLVALATFGDARKYVDQSPASASDASRPSRHAAQRSSV